MTEFDATPGTGITRRAVTRTAVWAVPAISVVSAAPAFAASESVDFSVSIALSDRTSAPYSLDTLPIIEIGISHVGQQVTAGAVVTVTVSRATDPLARSGAPFASWGTISPLVFVSSDATPPAIDFADEEIDLGGSFAWSGFATETPLANSQTFTGVLPTFGPDGEGINSLVMGCMFEDADEIDVRSPLATEDFVITVSVGAPALRTELTSADNTAQLSVADVRVAGGVFG